MRLFQSYKRFFENFDARPVDAEADTLAAEAYKCCVEWFGPPQDPQRPYKIWRAPSTCCSFGAPFRHYIIFLGADITIRDQLCEALGHEMYHRMTMHRKGLRQEVWIDEMLAFLASLWFLKHLQRNEYEKYVLQQITSQPGRVSVPALKASRRRQRLRDYVHATFYPPGFAENVGRLGIALTALASPQLLGQMLSVNTLEAWVRLSPPPLRYCLCRILEMPTEEIALEDADTYARFGYALQTVGDDAAAVEEYRKSLCLRPHHAHTLSHLAAALQSAGQTEAAIAALTEAADLDLQDEQSCSAVANLLWRQGDKRAAVEWYREALRRHANAYDAFYLGNLLYQLGENAGARTAWEQAVALDSKGMYGETARTMLDKYPQG